MRRIVTWIREWYITLRVLRDPARREVLLGRFDESNFVEVERP